MKWWMFSELVLLVLLFSFFYVKREQSFQHACYFGSSRRIPLWDRYEILDMGEGPGRVSILKQQDQNFSHMEVLTDDIAQNATNMVLLSKAPPCISSLNIQNGIVYGQTKVAGMTNGLYFIFKSDSDAFTYFSQKAFFLDYCLDLKVDGEDLLPFSECWKKYWVRQRDTPWHVLLDDLDDGFSIWECVIIGCIVSLGTLVFMRRKKWYVAAIPPRCNHP